MLFLSGQQSANSKHFCSYVNSLLEESLSYLLLEVDRHAFILKACAGLYLEGGSNGGTPLCYTP